MKYEVGEWLIWVQEIGGQTITDSVQVESLRKRGCAKLSNGWVVDEDGYAEGTNRMPGGHAIKVTDVLDSASHEFIYVAIDEHGVPVDFCLPNKEWTAQWRIEQIDRGMDFELWTVEKVVAVVGGMQFH